MWFFAPAAAADLAVGAGQPYLTVEAALQAAAPGDRILVDPGGYDVRETRLGLAVEIAPAAGAGTVTLRADSGKGLFVVEPGGALVLRDLALEGQGRQVATVTDASIAVVGGVVTGARGRDGGVIDATTATVSLEGVTIEAPIADDRGGVVHAVGSVVSMIGGSVRAAEAKKGGVFDLSAGSTLTVDGARFEANVADEGSVWIVTDGAAVASGVAFVGNVANNRGTVVCDTSDCTLAGVTFDGNVAPDAAVARALGGALSLSSSVLCRHGGDRAIEVQSGTLSLRDDVFVGNDVGDGLVVVDGGVADVLEVHFVGNTAAGSGAALAARGGATVSLQNTLVAYNTAGGPVVDVPSADLSGGWSLFHGNADADLPGGLRATDVAGDPLFPAPAPGSCDAAALAPPIASPAVDAGNPALSDGDGSRSDIGAFGGGDPGPVEVIDADADGWPAASDCDDADAAIHPLRPEVACDGVDQDCDPGTPDAVDDDQDGVTVCDGDCNDQSADRSAFFDVYRDRDGDGFGAGELTTLCGFPPTGASLQDGDCDDRDGDRFPGNTEVPYDDLDQDCDGEDLADVDGDGSPYPEDCRDEDPTVRPDAPEIEGDGVDQDCTGFDATSTVVGGFGFTCGCASARSGAAPGLALLAALVLRRRRAVPVTSRSGTR